MYLKWNVDVKFMCILYNHNLVTITSGSSELSLCVIGRSWIIGFSSCETTNGEFSRLILIDLEDPESDC